MALDSTGKKVSPVKGERSFQRSEPFLTKVRLTVNIFSGNIFTGNITTVNVLLPSDY